MEEQIIVLGNADYRKLIEITKNGYERINFGCIGTDKIITINIKSTQSSNNNKNNIVAKWMKEIDELAENGYMQSGNNDANESFAEIRAYCDAVITSVTT